MSKIDDLKKSLFIFKLTLSPNFEKSKSTLCVFSFFQLQL